MTDHATPALSIASLGGETMGTSWSVRLAVPGHADLHALHAAIQSQLDGVVRQMSTWEPDSDISRYNRGPAGSWHALPQAFFDVLECALQVAEASGGAFDPTIGPLIGLWGFGADAGAQAIPSRETLLQARQRIGWQRLHVQADGRRVLQPGGVQLDLSAIAKGYAVDAVAAHLRTRGIASALVEVGGELRGWGHKPDGSPWRVLVETAAEERDAGTEPRVLDLDGIAVATSGDRWHRFQSGDISYSHSIDPRSGQPVSQATAAVSVIAADAMHADAWATALTVMGETEGLAFAGRHGLAARFVTRGSDGLRERMTDTFRRHLAA